MKNKLRAFLAIAVMTFVLIIASPWGYSQEKTPSGDNIDGFPVVLNDKTLFMLQSPVGSFSPKERAETVSKRLEKIAGDDSISIDQIKLEQNKNEINIKSGNKTVLTVTKDDAKAVDESQKELAESYLQIIQESITQYRQERTATYRFLATIYTLIATLSILLLFLLINLIFPRMIKLIDSWGNRYLPTLRVQNLELISRSNMTNILVNFVKFLRFIIVIFIIYTYIPFVLSLFPVTRKFGQQLFHYLYAAIDLILKSLLSYLPNIFIVSLIIFTTYYILRFVRFIFAELERGTLSFPGFYQDWAQPTSNLLQFFIIALAAVVAFPYLPGFDSPAFRGISVFLGILFSLGSTSAVSNTVGGIILIYTRAFQLGDLVKIGDVTGRIEEKTLLVTRIRTHKNVLVTLPNSMLLNGNIINYSASARETKVPLIIHTTITLGYDNPWRDVHLTLINAAKATTYILSEPEPFVLQTALNDFYVSYEINAYTNDSTRLMEIYSELHQNIQDKCNEVGIEIMSPHYTTMRDGNQSTIPANYLPDNYIAPGFRVQSLKTSQSPENTD